MEVGDFAQRDQELAVKERVWELKLSPWRILRVTFPAESYDAGHRVWRDRAIEDAFTA